MSKETSPSVRAGGGFAPQFLSLDHPPRIPKSCPLIVTQEKRLQRVRQLRPKIGGRKERSKWPRRTFDDLYAGWDGKGALGESTEQGASIDDF